MTTKEIQLIEKLIDAKILEYHWIQSMKSSYAEEKTKIINQIKEELEKGGGE